MSTKPQLCIKCHEKPAGGTPDLCYPCFKQIALHWYFFTHKIHYDYRDGILLRNYMNRLQRRIRKARKRIDRMAVDPGYAQQVHRSKKGKVYRGMPPKQKPSL